MSYARNQTRHILEPNSTSLAMFASVGLHAILLVSMAFFPATSQPQKKPLRIVNLAPRNSQQGTGQQATTTGLENLRQRTSLPDLSAFPAPPIGNTTLGDSTASYISPSANRPDISGLKIEDTPNQSFPNNLGTTSSQPSPTNQSVRPEIPGSSDITAAPPVQPNNPGPQNSAPPILDPGAPLPLPPNFPFGENGNTPPTFPNTPPDPIPGENGPNAIAANQSPTSPSSSSSSGFPRIAIKSVKLDTPYPAEACQNRDQGSVEVEFYQTPQGRYVDGSVNILKSSGFSSLDTVASNTATTYVGPPTDNYQKYFSRFDFSYSEAQCTASGTPSTAPTTTPSITPSPSPTQSPTPKATTTPTVKPSPLPSASPKETITPTPQPTSQTPKPTSTPKQTPLQNPQPEIPSSPQPSPKPTPSSKPLPLPSPTTTTTPSSDASELIPIPPEPSGSPQPTTTPKLSPSEPTSTPSAKPEAPTSENPPE